MDIVITSFKVWFYTVLFNAALFGVLSAVQLKPVMLLAVPILIVGGLIVGLPFLVLNIILVKAASLLPYSPAGKICWIAAIQSAFVGLFYMSIEYALENRFSLFDPYVQFLTGTTIAALVIALYVNRSDFKASTAIERTDNE